MEVAGRRVIDDEGDIVEDVDIECDPCRGENVATTANGMCRECEEYMCDRCFRHHLKAKQCRNHVLVDIQNVSLIASHKSAENVDKCKHHANEQIKFYCRTHDIVGCGECMIPDHSGCNAENIKGLARGFEVNEDFKCLRKKLEGLGASNNENERKVRESKKANRLMYERALKDIRKFRKDVNEYLDKAETYVTNEAKDIENRNASLLTKLEQDCQLLSSKIAEIEQKVNTELYSDSALFIQTVNCKPLVHDIEQGVFRVQTANCIKEFEFVPEKHMQQLRSSVHNFGRITTSVREVNASLEAMKLPSGGEDKSVGLEDKAVAKPWDKEKHDLKTPQTFAVGARVRHARMRRSRIILASGTVTAVNQNNGNVSVKWDATGHTGLYHISLLQLI